MKVCEGVRVCGDRALVLLVAHAGGVRLVMCGITVQHTSQLGGGREIVQIILNSYAV